MSDGLWTYRPWGKGFGVTEVESVRGSLPAEEVATGSSIVRNNVTLVSGHNTLAAWIRASL